MGPRLQLLQDEEEVSVMADHGQQAAAGAGEEVEVRLRHKVGGQELHVLVPRAATMRDVLAAAARKLGNPAVLTAGRIVRPASCGRWLAAYAPEEHLGSRRRLLFIGSDLTPSALPATTSSLSSPASPASPASTTPATLAARGFPPSAASLALASPTTSATPALLAFPPFPNSPALASPTTGSAAVLGFPPSPAASDTPTAPASAVAAASEIGFTPFQSASALKPVLASVPELALVVASSAAASLSPATSTSDPNEVLAEDAAQVGIAAPAAEGAAAGLEPFRSEADAPPAEAAKPGTAALVEVRLRHRIDGTELHVEVPTGATMRDVLLAAAQTLGNEAVPRACRLVRKVGDFLTVYRDDDPLGSKRRLMVVGASLAPKAPAAADALPAPHAAGGEGAPAAVALEAAEVQEVKEALARTLGRTELPPYAEFVRQAGASLAPLRNDEHLGGRRLLLVSGAELSSGSGPGSAAEQVKPKPSPPPKLSRQRAITLQMEIYQAFARASFQQSLRKLDSQLRPGSVEHRRAVSDLCRKVHEEVIPNYGFAPTKEGAQQMVAALTDFSQVDAEVAKMGASILQLLTPKSEERGPKAASAKPPVLVAVPPPVLKEPPKKREEQDADKERHQIAIRSIKVKLERSREYVDLEVQAGGTVADLKKLLHEKNGVPLETKVLGKTKAGVLVPLEDSTIPRSSVVLKGVATLATRVRLTEDDMIKAMSELNKLYSKANFQKAVAAFIQVDSELSRRERLAELRANAQAACDAVLPQYGFQTSKEGLAEWKSTAQSFMRFPVFAELWRKSQVLLGTVTPEEATKQIRGCGKQAQREVCAVYGACAIRKISGYAALAHQKQEADDIFNLLYRRIYEENRQELWEGGRVRGHKMPTCQTVGRKLLEPAGSTLLSCVPGPSMTGPVMGGAVYYQVSFNVLRIARITENGEAAVSLQDVMGSGSGSSSSEGESSEGERQQQARISVGYIDALAALPGSHSGSAMVEYLLAEGQAEGWEMLALHSIRLEATLKFWERRGFACFAPGKDAAFRMACLQHCGRPAPLAGLERQLPPRPGCLLFVKFLGQR